VRKTLSTAEPCPTKAVVLTLFLCHSLSLSWPRHVNGMAERHEKAPLQRFRCWSVHIVATSVNGALQKWRSSATDRGKKLEQESSNQKKALQSQGQENLAPC
jgi:hypothetical protein